MRHYFFKYLSMILLAGCIFLFATCASDGQDGLPVSRTVLVYVSADNSLSDYVETNFEQIQKGYGYVNGAATNLLVYMDVKNEDPRLYHIYKKSGKVKKRVLRTYPEQDSSSSEAMANVFREAYDRYPASSYGMVLAFHGAGWLPENNYLNSAKVNRDKIPTRSEQKGKEMHLDIKAISKALDSTPYLDFIVFDACLMASAEVAY
ncbi:MAG: clostripain-related cysteine peptidase, partial [Bacteroidales bacterium]